VLLVDGVIQSVSPRDALAWGSYWAAMVPPFAPRQALVLGLGGATLPHLIAHRWGRTGTVLGVDDDADVLRAATQAGWFDLPGLQTVCADAFDFVRTCTTRFDYVGVDLYRGADLPPGVLSDTFLGSVAALLHPTGWLCINLYATDSSDRSLTALQSRFQIEHRPRVGENLVLHCRPRPHERLASE
jgi:spermidine synthase